MKFFNKNKNGEEENNNLHDEDFIADSKAAMLNKTTPLANIILYSVISFLIIGFIWASLAKIDEVTVAEGKVIPSSEVKEIQSLDGGTLKEVYVQEGNVVKKGQVLAKLDDTRYAADYGQALAKYVALSAMVARLTAESQGQETVTFPPELVKNYPELVNREMDLFKTRKEKLTGELAVIQHSYDLTNNEVQILEPMVKKGIVPKIDLLRAERTANELQGKIGETRDKEREDAMTDLNLRKADLAAVTESLAALRDKMERTTIVSPVSGIVKKINVYTLGGVIQPAMTLMEIVPLEDTLLVEARVKPIDIAFIYPGEKATVKVTAYDYTIYGGLEGVVEYISADAIEDEKTRAMDRSPITYYRVNVRTKKSYLGSETHKLPIIPGMMASVHIMTGQKTVLHYLLKPLIKAKEEALRER